MTAKTFISFDLMSSVSRETVCFTDREVSFVVMPDSSGKGVEAMMRDLSNVSPIQ